MELINPKTQEVIIVGKLEIANSFGSRFWGLIRKSQMPQDFALIIKPCNWIHTFFLRFPIDVIFLDQDNKIVSIVQQMQPNRIGKPIKNAKTVIELPSGTLSNKKVLRGDILIAVR